MANYVANGTGGLSGIRTHDWHLSSPVFFEAYLLDGGASGRRNPPIGSMPAYAHARSVGEPWRAHVPARPFEIDSDVLRFGGD